MLADLSVCKTLLLLQLVLHTLEYGVATEQLSRPSNELRDTEKL